MKYILLFIVGQAISASLKEVRQTGSCTGNKPGVNCETYGASVCTDTRYTGWVAENCCFYCLLQMGSSGGGVTPGVGHVPGSGGTGGSGTQLGGNTAGGVGYVPGSGGSGGSGIQLGGNTGGGSCTGDKAGVDCSSYGTTVCTDTKYAGWVSDNCCFFCMTHRGNGGTSQVGGGTSGGGGTQHSFNGHSTGCAYQGQVYQQGQTWKDGCKYKCSCDDATKGLYNCNALCLTWNSLPDVCTMSPPAPGKCCSTPKCPSYVQLQYPPGYVPE